MKPILFNTPMVQAILAGRKTQTRRVVKTGCYTPLEIGRSKFYTFCDELNGKPGAWAGFYCDRDVFVGGDGKQHIDAVYAKLPYQPGAILWVRETWNVNNLREDGDEYEAGFIYKAAEKPDYGFRWVETSPESYEKYMDGMSLYFDKWRPSIHMPKEAARLFLRVTDVRVERLWDISSEDVYAEGTDNRLWAATRDAFRRLWDSTIKKPGLDRYGWNTNPWVWVISFERITREGAEAALEEGTT